MITDAKRAELLLPILAAMDVVINGVAEQDDEYRATLEHLMRAMEDALDGLPDAKKSSLLRRGRRLHADTFAPCMAEGQQVAKTGLVLFYILRWLTDVDYLVIAPGCAMDRALAFLLPALQHAVEIEDLDRSARKQARKIFARLQWLGYYAGIPVDAKEDA